MLKERGILLSTANNVDFCLKFTLLVVAIDPVRVTNEVHRIAIRRTRKHGGKRWN